MHINKINTDEKVFIIAEIGNNHEGDFGLAQEMIQRAAETGVDAVKFQTYIPENYVYCGDSERIERLREFQLAESQFEELSNYALECGLVFFSTPFDISSAQFLNRLQPIFKIASSDNNFFPLIELVKEFDKPTLVSTGLADLQLLDIIYHSWKTKKAESKLAFLHCVASYPVPDDEANIGAIPVLKSRYPDVTIGYSDHTLGTDAAIYSVAAGARIVEKHFSIDKNYSDFRDHQLSAEPHEMKIMVDKIRQLEIFLGSGEKKPQPCEANSLISMRRSIAAARDVPEGTILQFDDLTWVRPGIGLPPGRESDVVGKRLKCSLRRGELIVDDMIAE